MHLRILKTTASTLLLAASFFGTGTQKDDPRITDLRYAEHKTISIFTPAGNEYRLDSWTVRTDGSVEGAGKWFAFRSRGKSLFYPYRGILPADSVARVTFPNDHSRTVIARIAAFLLDSNKASHGQTFAVNVK